MEINKNKFIIQTRITPSNSNILFCNAFNYFATVLSQCFTTINKCT